MFSIIVNNFKLNYIFFGANPLFSIAQFFLIIELISESELVPYYNFVYSIFLISFFEGLKSAFLSTKTDKIYVFMSILPVQIGLQITLLSILVEGVPWPLLVVFCFANAICGLRVLVKFDCEPEVEQKFYFFAIIFRSIPLLLLLYPENISFLFVVFVLIIGRIFEALYWIGRFSIGLDLSMIKIDFYGYISLLKYSSDRWFGWLRNVMLLNYWLPSYDVSDQTGYFLARRGSEIFMDGPGRVVENYLANRRNGLPLVFLLLTICVIVIGVVSLEILKYFDFRRGNYSEILLVLVFISQIFISLLHYSSLNKFFKVILSLSLTISYLAVYKMDLSFLHSVMIFAISSFSFAILSTV